MQNLVILHYIFGCVSFAARCTYCCCLPNVPATIFQMQGVCGDNDGDRSNEFVRQSDGVDLINHPDRYMERDREYFVYDADNPK